MRTSICSLILLKLAQRFKRSCLFNWKDEDLSKWVSASKVSNSIKTKGFEVFLWASVDTWTSNLQSKFTKVEAFVISFEICSPQSFYLLYSKFQKILLVSISLLIASTKNPLNCSLKSAGNNFSASLLWTHTEISFKRLVISWRKISLRR